MLFMLRVFSSLTLLVSLSRDYWRDYDPAARSPMPLPRATQRLLIEGLQAQSGIPPSLTAAPHVPSWRL